MDSIRVVAAWDFDEQQMEQLRAAAPNTKVRRVKIGPNENPLPHVCEAEVLLIHELRFDLARAPGLAWVQVPSAGVDHLLDLAIMRSDIQLTTASGIHAVPIAEHVMAMMLGWCRRIPLTSRWQVAGEWPRERSRYQASELRGATVGIVGYGSIGRQVARLARGLGMRILAVRRSEGRADTGWCEPGVGDPAGELPERIYGPQELGSMLPECDYVVIAAPLTRETRHLIGAPELAAMKENAYLANISRGSVVDESALVTALRERRIAGAGLDVFAGEPLAPDSILWRLGNVTLTPHVAGSSHRYNERLALLFADNLARYAAGKPLMNAVDKEKGY